MNNIIYYNPKYVNKNHKNTYNKLMNFIGERIDFSASREFRIGYETFGVLLYGFCQWLHENIQKNGIDKIIFMARDGYIIQKAYEILYPNSNTNYMYVSRRSLSLPSMAIANNIDEMLDCMILPPIFNIETFLASLNIKYQEVEEIVKKVNINKEELFKRSEFKKNDKLIQFIKTIEDQIKMNSKMQSEFFNDYLKQLNVNGKVAIIDIGWHNSIQDNIIKIINNDIQLYGYYLGVYKDAKLIKSPHKAKGFLYNYETMGNRQTQTFAFVSLLESMFLSHEGTTIYYKKENRRIVPVLLEYEYGKNENMTKTISDFQDGAIKFIKDLSNSDISNNLTIDSSIACANLIKFGINPKKEDIAIFGNLNFENYNINNIINYKHTFIYYLIHPKTALKDFYQSGWRIMFIKRLLPFPFPHYSIFKLICKIFNRK